MKKACSDVKMTGKTCAGFLASLLFCVIHLILLFFNLALSWV